MSKDAAQAWAELFDVIEQCPEEFRTELKHKATLFGSAMHSKGWDRGHRAHQERIRTVLDL